MSTGLSNEQFDNFVFESVTFLSADDWRDAVDGLAGSYEKSPLFEHAFEDPRKRRAAASALFAAVLQDGLRFGRVRIARNSGLKAILIWYPPACYPLTLGRRIRQLYHHGRIALTSISGYFKIYRAARTISPLHPKEPHLYASYLGVAPGCTGAGKALVDHLVQEAYRTGLPIYGETQELKNVRWYLRQGARILHHGRQTYPGGPPFWTIFGHPDEQ